MRSIADDLTDQRCKGAQYLRNRRDLKGKRRAVYGADFARDPKAGSKFEIDEKLQPSAALKASFRQEGEGFEIGAQGA